MFEYSSFLQPHQNLPDYLYFNVKAISHFYIVSESSTLFAEELLCFSFTRKFEGKTKGEGASQII